MSISEVNICKMMPLQPIAQPTSTSPSQASRQANAGQRKRRIINLESAERELRPRYSPDNKPEKKEPVVPEPENAVHNEAANQRAVEPEQINNVLDIPPPNVPFIVSDIVKNKYLVVAPLTGDRYDSLDFTNWLVIHNDIGVFKMLRVYQPNKVELGLRYVEKMGILKRTLPKENFQTILSVDESFYIDNDTGHRWFCMIFDHRSNDVVGTVNNLITPEKPIIRHFHIVENFAQKAFYLIGKCHEQNIIADFKLMNVTVKSNHLADQNELSSLMNPTRIREVLPTSFDRKLMIVGGKVSGVDSHQMAVNRFTKARYASHEYLKTLQRYETEDSMPTLKIMLEFPEVKEADLIDAVCNDFANAFDLVYLSIAGPRFETMSALEIWGCMSSIDNWTIQEKLFAFSFFNHKSRLRYYMEREYIGPKYLLGLSFLRGIYNDWKYDRFD